MDVDLNSRPAPEIVADPIPSVASSSRLDLPPTTSGRLRKFPRRFTDFLPHSTGRTGLPDLPRREPTLQVPSVVAQSDPLPEPLATPVADSVTFSTLCNDFGLYRVYTSYLATKDPDDNADLGDLCDAPGLSTSSRPDQTRWWKSLGIAPSGNKNIFAPFLNSTVFRLMNWFYSGSNMKSVAELDRLVQEVLLADDFDRKHLTDFSASKELQRLDEEDPVKSPFADEHGWKSSTVKIPLPAERFKHTSEAAAPILEVPNVHHRSITEVVTSAYQDESSKAFHHTPYRLYWKPKADSVPERVITEVVNSDAFIEEHAKVMKEHPESGPWAETVIAALMLWSDSTHLANFGNAALWPIYLFFGNLTKYTRAKPSEFAAHHIAYIPSDIYMKAFDGVAASAATITHLKRELMHAIWLLLLDAEFMSAYVNGIIVKCADGIIRRIFPRFFTYSADYPEKILLATIRQLAKCPCPRCLIQKCRIGGLGTRVDDQRRQLGFIPPKPSPPFRR
ncbi:hypothetical protein CVT26_001311 [Gymnopilus dilepis]|uniref:Uncharacterized protein n=1 Tax=Gymnopilus dilepis TaxID=231916 RepID=A0A409X515_9AGAR|nr:hypothetical protein CVT26_001311 [Gymnopilus dilepis]